MDIDRVRYFHVFSETGSLVKAAEILHISQPALSKAFKILEHEVGAKLFEADGRGLRLTPAGALLKKETTALLEHWLQVPKKILAGESLASTKIGSFEVFTTYFLGHLINYTKLETLELHECGPGQLEQAVADSVVDIGITYVPIPKAGVAFVEAARIRMGVFGLKKFKHTPLAQLPFVAPLAPVMGTPSKVIGLDGWPDHEVPRSIKFRVTMLESAMELCRQGLCVAYIPEFVAKLHNKNVLSEFKLIEHEAPIAPKNRMQSVFIVQRKQSSETALVRQIAKCLRSLS